MNKDIIGEFEDSLSDNIKNPDIKYSLDKAIDGEVKYRYLTEKFGIEKVEALVSDFLLLSDFEFFTRIKEKLQKDEND
jgi:hypothetical protein